MSDEAFALRWKAPLREHMKLLGYVGNSEGGIYVRPIDSTWKAWLGINKASYQGSVVLNPVIGVRNDPLEKLLGSFRGRRLGLYSAPTYSTTLLYLSGSMNPSRWEVLKSMSDSECGAVIDDIVAVLQTDGPRFLEEHASLDKIAELIAPSPMVPGVAFRYPLILAIQGRYEEALAYAGSYLDSCLPEGSESAYVSLYRKYLQSLSVFVGQSLNGNPA